MSVLFDVSVDFLLDEDPGPTTDAKMRVPIDLENVPAGHASTGAKQASLTSRETGSLSCFCNLT